MTLHFFWDNYLGNQFNHYARPLEDIDGEEPLLLLPFEDIDGDDPPLPLEELMPGIGVGNQVSKESEIGQHFECLY